LKGLGLEIDNIEEKLEDTKVQAERASAAVGNTHTDALKIYTDIYSLNIPEINIPKLKQVAELTAAEVSWPVKYHIVKWVNMFTVVSIDLLFS